jgi:hypothetical protein
VGAQGASPTNTTPNLARMGVNASLGPQGTIQVSGDITASFSDMRLKDNISLINNSIDKLMSISGIFYRQNRHAEKFGYPRSFDRKIGVIAQQVDAVMPEVVAPAPFDVDEHGNSISGENYLTVQYDRLVPLIVQVINEQQDRIIALSKVIGVEKQ